MACCAGCAVYKRWTEREAPGDWKRREAEAGREEKRGCPESFSSPRPPPAPKVRREFNIVSFSARGGKGRGKGGARERRRRKRGKGLQSRAERPGGRVVVVAVRSRDY